MKSCSKIIPIDLYRRDILFVFGDVAYLRKTMCKYHTKEQIDALFENFEFSEYDSGKTIYSKEHNAFIVWMPHLPQNPADSGTLSHEIFHAVQALMANIGAALSDDSEEAYAYLIGYITKRVIESFPICSFCKDN